MRIAPYLARAVLLVAIACQQVKGYGQPRQSTPDEKTEAMAEQLRIARDIRYSHSERKGDGSRAFKMFEEIAERGGDTLEAAAALFELGHYYLHGTTEVKQDLTKAAKYFDQASQLGDYDAAHGLAFLYATGYGGHKVDERLSLELEEMAAVNGHIMSSMSLGYRFLNGYGAPKDCERALMFYKEAAIAAIQSEGAYIVPPLTEADRLTDKTVKQTAQDQAQNAGTREYWEAKAWQGDASALYEVAKMYDTGAFGTKPDLLNAAEAYKAAAEKGLPAAMADLGLMYAHGQGVPQDYDQAVDLLTKAAEAMDAGAQNALAYMYRMGVALDVDHHKARELFAQAADAGQAEALHHLGEYAFEEGDYATAVSYFRRAGAAGYILGRFREGQLYESGVDDYITPRSCARAVAAYKDVAESGYWLDDMRVGLEDLRDGKLESAMITMALMAERGWALAQANAAYLIERKMGYRDADCGPLIWRSPILIYDNAEKLALRFYEHAVAQGDEASVYDLANLQLKAQSGAGVSRAVSLLESAAENGDLRALHRLAGMYETGEGGVAKNLDRAEEMYRSLIALYATGASSGSTSELVATQTMLHLRVAKLVATRGVQSLMGGWGGVQTGTGTQAVAKRVRGEVYWLVNEKGDGKCLGGQGRMEPCGDGSMWAIWGKGGKDKALVRFGDDARIARCLVVGEGGKVQVADCASSGAKRWKVDDKGALRFEDGRTFCLVRQGDEVKVRACKDVGATGSLILMRREVSLGMDGGFQLRSKKDGLCFLGTSFGPCERIPEAQWAMAPEPDQPPGSFQLYRATFAHADGRKICLRRRKQKQGPQLGSDKRVKREGEAETEDGELVMGLCVGKGAGAWRVRDGKIEGEEGTWCVGREGMEAKLVRRESKCEAIEVVVQEGGSKVWR